MQQVYEQIAQVAPTNSTVLMRGETGTGKELVAHAIHDNSRARRRPFVKVNCAALPETLLESELFGHEKGAFTGAQARKQGRFELADGGTLFLDEIGELPPGTPGQAAARAAGARVRARGRHRDDQRRRARRRRDQPRPRGEHDRGRQFREDLYYRLNVFPIVVPPLRERRRTSRCSPSTSSPSTRAQHGKRSGGIATPAHRR